LVIELSFSPPKLTTGGTGRKGWDLGRKGAKRVKGEIACPGECKKKAKDHRKMLGGKRRKKNCHTNASLSAKDGGRVS